MWMDEREKKVTLNETAKTFYRRPSEWFWIRCVESRRLKFCSASEQSKIKKKKNETQWTKKYSYLNVTKSHCQYELIRSNTFAKVSIQLNSICLCLYASIIVIISRFLDTFMYSVVAFYFLRKENKIGHYFSDPILYIQLTSSTM